MGAFSSSRRVAAWAWVLGWLLLWAGVLRAQPVIESPPAGTTVYESQAATLNVVASGTPPLSYQWRMMGTNVPGAVLPTLVLTNVSLSGTALLDVVVANASGSVTSAPVLLVVLARPVPTLSFGAYEPGPVATVPVVYTAFGGENRVGFSVAFNPLGLASPRFVSALTNVPGSVHVTTGTNGWLGVQVTLADGATFPPGPGTLGTLAFDGVPGAPRYAAGLALTNSPVDRVSGPVGGTNFVPVTLPVEPAFRVVDASAKPVLDGQSGLFLHRLELGNPGLATNTTVELRVGGFTNDSAGNLIRVYNALGTNLAGEWRVFLKNLAPGEARPLTVEFYIPDLVTVPVPSYSAGALGTIGLPNVSARTLLVDHVRFFTNASYPDGAMLIEFPTEAGRRYYVQYAPTAEGLVGLPGERKTAEPAILGTGSRVQWVDYGPPKTDSAPGRSNRFYRVIFGR